MNLQTENRLLRGFLKDQADLDSSERSAMFHLLQKHFKGVTQVSFERDLQEKNQVILLKDAAGVLSGFTTLKFYDAIFRAETVRIIFSGDTIVEPASWGSTALPKTWIEAAIRHREKEPKKKLFWLLICSGYRTYHFLRLFFKKFYPRFDETTPEDIRTLRDQLAQGRYGSQYDPQRGVLCFKEGAQALSPGIGDVTPEKLRNPHIAFFTQANPGHFRGDELVCLTEVADDNVTAVWHRLLRGGT